MSEQPLALRLADHIERTDARLYRNQAAAELRRLHSVNAELLAALRGVLLWGTNTNYEGAEAAVDAARAAISLATPAPVAAPES